MEKIENKILSGLENTYCRIKRSKIEGVGVYAIRDIPKNTDPFLGARKQRWHKINKSALKDLDKNILKMINDFWAMDEGGNFAVPECGLNGIDISFFLNTSSKPNVRSDDGINFKTARKIKKGEELTVSYSTYDARY